MNKPRSNQNKVDTVFVLMIFVVFAVSVLLVLMLSGSTYQNMIEISSEGQNERIALSYIRTKVRNADSAGSVYVSKFNDLTALSLVETFGGTTFVTYIYLYDGWIHELFHERGQDFLPQHGVPVIRADSLSFETVDGGLISVVTDFGSLLIFPRSASENVVIEEGF